MLVEFFGVFDLNCLGKRKSEREREVHEKKAYPGSEKKREPVRV